MPGNGPPQPSTGLLGPYSAWELRFVVGVAGLTTGLSALRLAFNLGYNQGIFEALDGVHTTCCVNFLESWLIPITLALAVSTVGLYLNRLSSFLLSLIALLAILMSYIAWYLGTLSILRRAEVERFSQLPSQSQRVLTLAYASWWDIWVLVFAILLILWLSEKLSRSLGSAFAKFRERTN